MVTLEHDIKMRDLITQFHCERDLTRRHALLVSMTPIARGWAQTCAPGAVWPGEEAAAALFELHHSGRRVGPTLKISERERELR